MRIPLSDAAMSTSGRLRTLFRRERRALPPHHRPAHGHSASKGAQRHDPGSHGHARPTGCRKPPLCWVRQKALEIINRMPEYDAVFVCPDGRVLYSNGLRPPVPRPADAPPAAATATSPVSHLEAERPPPPRRPIQSSVFMTGHKATPLGAQVSTFRNHRAPRFGGQPQPAQALWVTGAPVRPGAVRRCAQGASVGTIGRTTSSQLAPPCQGRSLCRLRSTRASGQAVSGHSSGRCPGLLCRDEVSPNRAGGGALVTVWLP